MKYEVDIFRNIEVRIKNKILKENSKLKGEKINRLIIRKSLCKVEEKVHEDKKIHDDMVKTLGENSPCYSTVKKWVADFKWDRESTDYDAWTGRPKSSTSDACPGGRYLSYGDE